MYTYIYEPYINAGPVLLHSIVPPPSPRFVLISKEKKKRCKKLFFFLGLVIIAFFSFLSIYMDASMSVREERRGGEERKMRDTTKWRVGTS